MVAMHQDGGLASRWWPCIKMVALHQDGGHAKAIFTAQYGEGTQWATFAEHMETHHENICHYTTNKELKTGHDVNPWSYIRHIFRSALQAVGRGPAGDRSVFLTTQQDYSKGPREFAVKCCCCSQQLVCLHRRYCYEEDVRFERSDTHKHKILSIYVSVSCSWWWSN